MPTTLKTYVLVALSAASLLFSACGHDTSPVPGFTALLNGQPWESDPADIKATLTNGQFRITPDYCGVTLFFYGETPGNYTTGRDQSNYGIAQNTDCLNFFYTNLEDLNTGLLEITRIDKVKKLINGRFSFTAKSKTGETLTVEDGVFTDIAYTDEPGNTDKKPMRGWIEEDGKKYALNNFTYTNNTLSASTSSRSRTMSFFWTGISFYPDTFDLTPVGDPNGNPHLYYLIPESGLIASGYDPAPGSKFIMTVPPGSATSFLGSFDIMLVKEPGLGVGPASIHLKSEFEVYQ